MHRLEHGYGDLSIGTELVGRIIDNNAYDCKILFNYAMGNNSGTDPENNYAYMWYDDNNVAHSNEGCGAVIQLGYDTPSPWVESGEYMEQEKMPLYIAIGHEMIHALRIMGETLKILIIIMIILIKLLMKNMKLQEYHIMIQMVIL
ncbi:MAG: hypothetical protein V8T08_09790 [Monoglobus pectinilyticus]